MESIPNEKVRKIVMENLRAIEEENRRRTELSFPDENERLEYQKLLESKGQSFLEALNEADPNGVVLGYLSSQEKYPIVMKNNGIPADEIIDLEFNFLEYINVES